MIGIGTYIITLLVAVILIVAAYFIGENRGDKAVAVERKKLAGYRDDLSLYIDHFGDRISQEAKENFTSFVNMLKAKFGSLL